MGTRRFQGNRYVDRPSARRQLDLCNDRGRARSGGVHEAGRYAADQRMQGHLHRGRDFVPGIPPYEVVTIVDLQAPDDGLTVTIKFDAMHDDIWTERARAGHESQLRKLDALLASSRSPDTGRR